MASKIIVGVGVGDSVGGGVGVEVKLIEVDVGRIVAVATGFTMVGCSFGGEIFGGDVAVGASTGRTFLVWLVAVSSSWSQAAIISRSEMIVVKTCILIFILSHLIRKLLNFLNSSDDSSFFDGKLDRFLTKRQRLTWH